MAWETRGRHRYYYAARKVGRKVVKTYFGGGPAGRLAAGSQAEGHARRASRSAAAAAEKARLEPARRAAAELDAACDRMLAAALEALGYHRHDRGPWRRRRGPY